MIRKADIARFGSFKDFVWKDRINKDGSIVEFKKLNILYGRNYSGKTTLSRLVRTLEIGELPPRYESPAFSITTDSGIVTPEGIGTHSHHVRVFNKDFVDAHLSFLHDDEGNIEPFAIVGGDNTRIERQIAEKETELGSAEKETGLSFECARKHDVFVNKLAEQTAAVDERKSLLTSKARDIKQNGLYAAVTYNITKIEVDIAEVQKDGFAPPSAEAEDSCRVFLKQDQLPTPEQDTALNLALPNLYSKAESALSKEIRPTAPLQELLDDTILQSWAKDGMPLHRDKRETCGFCGAPLPDSLWAKLDQHFSEESQELEGALNDLIREGEEELMRTATLLSIGESDLYPTIHAQFEKVATEIKAQLAVYTGALQRIIDGLRARLADPFRSRELTGVNDNSAAVQEAFGQLESLIKMQEAQTNSLDRDQSAAREKLRLATVSRFVTDIDLASVDDKIAQITKDAEGLEAEVHDLKARVKAVEGEIDALRKQLRDESKGAEKVNQYLTHYFGHDSLRLVSVDEEGEEAGVRFEVRRGDQRAYNLSDGECSLLAFCYFMGKLEDAESQDKQLIIYIDDPVSSLDSDHIFFVFSLIQSLIATPTVDGAGKECDRYKQLFVSTHNLDFLKYLKRLSKPKSGGREHFILVRTPSGSTLELMPFYLRHYVTEFHYLFDQICACAANENGNNGHHCFFSFGNNLRKFLEVYLFFRFPFCENSNGDQNRRLERFLNDDPVAEPLVMRVTNELSHTADAFDRTVRPIDYGEISRMASYVLGKVKLHDEAQYTDLLQATGRDDPLSEEEGAEG